MIRNIFNCMVLAALLAMTSCSAGQSQENGGFNDPTAFSTHESFRTIRNWFEDPSDMKLAVYWYWINDNISEEGVKKDLQAMKEVGINRAFIGNVTADLPWGDVKMFTPEWWKVTHAALKEASRLGIEIGIFNSPGWSQSGGPWVKPEQSMRYLDCADLTVDATGGPLTVKLPEVAPDAMEDVRIIAYPAIEARSDTKRIVKQEGTPITLDFKCEEGAYRTLTITPIPETKIITNVTVTCGGDTLRRFLLDRSNPDVQVGYLLYAPVVIGLPEGCTGTYTVAFSEEGQGTLNVSFSTRPLLERYAEKSLGKMFQTPLPMWDAYLWDAQPAVAPSDCIDTASVVDLTAMVKDGVLEWNDAPQGRWTISRLAMRTTGKENAPASPEGTGLEIDKLSREHVAYHFDSYIGDILRKIPASDRKTFKVVVEDSYETGGLDWTDDMAEKFVEVYGYDPTPYLPALSGKIVGSPDLSDRFLWDLRRLIADRVAYDYVGGLREESHKYGLSTWLENYGHWGFPSEFLMYGGQSDEISGEFWSEGSLGDIENRASSSCGHTYGKRKVWAESCTSGGPVFSRYPRIMKQRLDRFFTEGINSTLLHLFVQQAYEECDPGICAWFGNEFNRKNTWFSHLDFFGEYMKRCNMMLQQGLYVADVAYFIGEDTPKMIGVCDPALPKGYSFDYINAEVLLTRAEVRDGRLTLPDGMSYSVLVLPKMETMRPELLARLKQMVSDGLVILGPAPKRSPSLQNYPEADAQVSAMAEAMWGDCSRNHLQYGYGQVFGDGVSLEKVFETLAVEPDFETDADNLLFIHRTLPTGDIYFVSNQLDEAVEFNATFRTAHESVELWNPLTGEIRSLPEFSVKDGRTTVPLKLESLESSFIVMRENGVKPEYASNYPALNQDLEIDTPWTLTFESGRRGPADKVQADSLFDWTTSADNDIKYFSGKVTYRNNFTLEAIPAGDVYVDLGMVMVTAKVRINGKYAGGVWTHPYRLCISDYVKRGNNSIEVEVANNWMNRIIGDLQLKPADRKVWLTVNPWEADSPLQPSGLMGPVKILHLDK